MTWLLALLALATPLSACDPSSQQTRDQDAFKSYCVTLNPAGPFHHYALPQTSPLPYRVTLDPLEVTDSQLVRVTLTGTGRHRFLGFMAQARRGDATYPLGVFYPEDGQMKSVTCTNHADTAIHNNDYPKTNVTLSWDPPLGFHGQIDMYISVVETPALFWSKHLAGTITVN